MLKKILPFFMLVTVAFTIASAWAKLTHQSWADDAMPLVLVFIAISLVLGLREVFQSEHIDNTEKIMWTVAFIFLMGLGFIVYLIFGRKRVIGTSIAYRERYRNTI